MFIRFALIVAVVGMIPLRAGTAAGEQQSMTRGNFALAKSKTLHVRYQQMTLVARDELDYTEGFEKADKLILDQQDGTYILNVIQEHGDVVRYRKEVALSNQGIELTVRFKLFPYKNNADEPSILYRFAVPFEVLEGSTFKACVGRVRGPKLVEGKAGAHVSGIRYIAFKSDKVKLVFDFNPMGVCSYGDYCSWGEPVGCWAMQKEEDSIIFSFGYKARFYGGVFMSKCLIYEGEYDYEGRHAYLSWGYRGSTVPSSRFSFGTVTPPEGFTKADINCYSKEKGFGWEKEQDLSLVKTKECGIANNCLFSPDGGENAFIVDIIPGYYVMTLRVANHETDTGPFDISINGEKCVDDVSAKKGEVRTITFARYVREDGKMRIGFSGAANWGVSSIVLQPLIYRTEDYAFDRGLWNMPDLFTPY